MTALNPNSSALPTRIGVRAIRADLMFRWALERGDRVTSIADVRALCASWANAMFDEAVDDNVALGRFAEDATGRLIVAERAA